MDAPQTLNYQDAVRLLMLVSSAVLAWSSWKQYDWQRTQAARDEEAEKAREEYEATSSPSSAPAPAPSSESEEARRERERGNVAKLKYVAAKNAARPFFDARAYFYFLLGFAVSVVASLVDILWSGTIGRIIDAIRRAIPV